MISSDYRISYLCDTKLIGDTKMRFLKFQLISIKNQLIFYFTIKRLQKVNTAWAFQFQRKTSRQFMGSHELLLKIIHNKVFIVSDKRPDDVF